MESIYPELALCGSKNECGRTDTVFSPISQVCTRGVTLTARDHWSCSTKVNSLKHLETPSFEGDIMTGLLCDMAYIQGFYGISTIYGLYPRQLCPIPWEFMANIH